ncbi:MAG: hypothetical protein OIF50_04960 [Flavobacteriaceae bacterium]|nr:hypothetical protein [Flavobacteriaceae bacterium]
MFLIEERILLEGKKKTPIPIKIAAFVAFALCIIPIWIGESTDNKVVGVVFIFIILGLFISIYRLITER